jgi:hypothetical protein
MKWIAISGSWRKTSPEVERDVREAVRAIIMRGDGIVTGGALNVDWQATDEALKFDPTASHIKVFIPVTLERYAAHYRKRANEGVITPAQAEMLIAQLTRLKTASPKALVENVENTIVDQTTYFERITQIVNASDELAAFQVNNSEGVQDTINKAQKQGKPIHLKSYEIV